jgi:NAD-dependent DNA ligase
MPRPKGSKNKKRKITTSSSQKNKKTSNEKTKRAKKNTDTRKKKKLIIESSTPSPEIKKIDSILPEKIGETKTDLKISPNIKQMTTTPVNKPQTVLPSGRLNEKFIDLMEQLSNIMLKQGEPFRARAYQKAQETIMAYPNDILSPADLKGKPGIGSTIMEKLEEYVKTGTLKVLERERSNPVNILTDVYGIGPKKAKELVDKGITTIEQLRENQQMLNDVQKVGLKYYEDVMKRIPRSEIQQYESIFESEFKKVATPDSRFEIVGSYRRGAQNSGDIDVIITSENAKVFINFIDELIKKNIILEILSRGPTKCLVMAKIPSSDSARRVDFLYTSLEEFPFAILYFTGSKMFNTVMRNRALQMGLTMNEHGLYTLQEKKKGEKVDSTFKDEKDIFDYLHMEYKTPVERIDGRAVIIKKVKPTMQIDESKESTPQIKKTHKKRLIIESDSTENDNKIVQSAIQINMENTVDKSIVAIATDFKKNGISVLEKLNENQLASMLREANKAYYNQEPFMTDNEYDIVKEFMEKKYPSNQVINEIGAPIESGSRKVTLPYLMGSMDKIKPDTGVLANWMSKYKGPYILSCKLDGVSGLYSTEGSGPKLYTRGDGKVGQDISHLIPYLRLPKTKGIVIRGEFIIPKTIFETKYKTKFANPRNMVAGIVNHKTVNEAIKDLHFVAYEVIKPVKKPSEQMVLLSTLDVDVVLWKLETNLTNELLSQTLVDWRKNYVYEIDGVIVTNDAIYERKSGNPDHAFAFKMVLSDQIAEAKVVDVIWTPSKDGYLKPRVQIEPIHLGGVRIEYATGFNGAFINDNKVGVGAIIELIRSGDVIPHIRKVNVPAEQAKMPSVPYKWNDTHIDVLLEDAESDETVKEKNITGFFRGIGVEGLSSGNVSRIIKAGFDTVPKIIKMTVADLLKVEGFKDKTATKLYNGIQEKIASASLVTVMSASNLFGRGFSEKKLEMIMDPESGYPGVLFSNESDVKKAAKIAQIKGMASKTAEAFVEKIPQFIQFLKEAGLEQKLITGVTDKKEFDQSHPLFGKSIVMTGFRDDEIQQKLKNVGAKLGSSVSKNTFIVLVKNIDEDTGKAAEARKLGIPLMTPEEFKNKYFNAA